MSLSPAENDFIDIHTHSKKTEKGIFRILNIFSHDYAELPGLPVSIGLHPWHIKDNEVENLEEILQLSATLPQVKAIGETGLDRVISTGMEKQEQIFETHIRVADDVKKPLIIHCVKAYSGIVSIKNKFKPDTAWIIHGFNGNLAIAKELVAHGFYISLSPRLLKNMLKTADIKNILPSGRIFAETDEDKTPIETIYHQIAELYNTNVPGLKEIMRENYFNVFKS